MKRALGGLLVCALLPGCTALNMTVEKLLATGATPVIRGSDGGLARLTIITCPHTLEGIQAAEELLNAMINYNSEIVIARNGGMAVLTLNACPAPELQLKAVPVPAPRRTR